MHLAVKNHKNIGILIAYTFIYLFKKNTWVISHIVWA